MLRLLPPCLLSLALLLAGAPARAQGLPADWRWVSLVDRGGLGVSASDLRILGSLGD